MSGGHVLDVGPGHVQRPPDPRHLQVVTVRVQFNKFLNKRLTMNISKFDHLIYLKNLSQPKVITKINRVTDLNWKQPKPWEAGLFQNTTTSNTLNLKDFK